MSRIQIDIPHRRAANKRQFFNAENRLSSKGSDGFANAWPCSSVEVIQYRYRNYSNRPVIR